MARINEITIPLKLSFEDNFYFIYKGKIAPGCVKQMEVTTIVRNYPEKDEQPFFSWLNQRFFWNFWNKMFSDKFIGVKPKKFTPEIKQTYKYQVLLDLGNQSFLCDAYHSYTDNKFYINGFIDRNFNDKPLLIYHDLSDAERELEKLLGKPIDRI